VQNWITLFKRAVLIFGMAAIVLCPFESVNQQIACILSSCPHSTEESAPGSPNSSSADSLLCGVSNVWRREGKEAMTVVFCRPEQRTFRLVVCIIPKVSIEDHCLLMPKHWQFLMRAAVPVRPPTHIPKNC
jgi:hypothetical protein